MTFGASVHTIDPATASGRLPVRCLAMCRKGRAPAKGNHPQEWSGGRGHPPHLKIGDDKFTIVKYALLPDRHDGGQGAVIRLTFDRQS
jgi:hypothetical protein